MKPNKTLHVVLAGVGCVSLLVYILACSTSFSPDDSQVLYPAFDKQSGAVSVAVYDRRTAHSENIFTAVAPSQSLTNQDLLLTRAQWIDANHILIAHVLSGHDEGLALLVVPRGVNEPIRQLLVPEIESPAVVLEFPFCLVNSTLYLRDEKTITRLDLVTGHVRRIEETNNVVPMPGGDGRTIVGITSPDDDQQAAQVGLIDPDTLEFKPLLTITNEFAEGVMPTFDVRSHRTLFVTDTDSNLQLNVMKDGQIQFSRPVARAGVQVAVGPWLDLGPNGDRVFTAYMSGAEGATNVEYGVVEIPLSRDPLRWTALFHAEGEEDGLLFAQPSLSHDGQTWAIATSYLYLQNESLKPEDCALFLVEVGQPEPKVTKVPIQPPEERRKLAGF